MPAATIIGGPLKPIQKCYIIIPNGSSEEKIVLDNLPDITDTKSASYNDEIVIGRSSPVKTYSQSDNRAITMQLHFVVSKPSDVSRNLRWLRAIQSAVYPRLGNAGAPFIPPPVCRIKCGKLFAEDGDLCVILKNYSVKFPTEVAWDEENFTPFKFDIDTTWDVVYKSAELPGQEKIFSLGK